MKGMLELFLSTKVMSFRHIEYSDHILWKPYQTYQISSNMTTINTWVLPKIVVPQNGWFIMENPLGVPLFSCIAKKHQIPVYNPNLPNCFCFHLGNPIPSQIGCSFLRSCWQHPNVLTSVSSWILFWWHLGPHKHAWWKINENVSNLIKVNCFRWRHLMSLSNQRDFYIKYGIMIPYIAQPLRGVNLVTWPFLAKIDIQDAHSPSQQAASLLDPVEPPNTQWVAGRLQKGVTYCVDLEWNIWNFGSMLAIPSLMAMILWPMATLL